MKIYNTLSPIPRQFANYPDAVKQAAVELHDRLIARCGYPHWRALQVTGSFYGVTPNTVRNWRRELELV